MSHITPFDWLGRASGSDLNTDTHTRGTLAAELQLSGSIAHWGEEAKTMEEATTVSQQLRKCLGGDAREHRLPPHRYREGAAAGEYVSTAATPVATAQHDVSVCHNDRREDKTEAQTVVMLVRLQHMRGLYRGVGVNLIGSAPAMTLYLSTYEASRDTLQQVEFFHQRPSLSYLSAGMAAQAVSCVLWVPIDVIKQRMQVQTQARAGVNPSIYYRSTLHAMQTIAKTEGLRGFYKGFVASMVSFGPYSSLYFMLYEKNKAMAKAYLGVEYLPPQFTLAGAALASATASFLTNPLDLVKLRIQIQRGPIVNAGVVDGLTQVVRVEGVRALFKGAGARVAYHAPCSAITMALFESCRRFFADLLNTNVQDKRLHSDHNV
ncbi:hypothetical protein FI667_g5166, partial [Globisporangium splendens]